MQLRPIEWANIVFISAKTGQRVKRVLDAASAASEEHRRRITTSTMNLVLREAQVGGVGSGGSSGLLRVGCPRRRCGQGCALARTGSSNT